MKKILALILALTMLFALAACGKAESAEKTFTVGVCQLVQHPALDAATKGFVDTLKEKLGDRVTVTVLNGSGDQPSCAVIANQFVSDEVDLIMANATPALVACAAATDKIPILGTSITAYGAAFGLDDWDARTTQRNISGTSDLAPLDEQAAMVKTFCPDAKTVGILFCSAEANSRFQVDTIKPMLEELGFTVNTYSFDDSNSVAAVTTNAVGECDALYIPTDNTTASCAETINNIARPAGVPIIAGESGLCSGCGIATLSIDYYALGCATAEMALEILLEGKDVGSLPIRYSPEFTKMFNAGLCEALGVDVPDEFVPIE